VPKTSSIDATMWRLVAQGADKLWENTTSSNTGDRPGGICYDFSWQHLGSARR